MYDFVAVCWTFWRVVIILENCNVFTSLYILYLTLSGFHVFLHYRQNHCDFNPAALVNKALLLFLFRVEERLTARSIDKF